MTELLFYRLINIAIRLKKIYIYRFKKKTFDSLQNKLLWHTIYKIELK